MGPLVAAVLVAYVVMYGGAGIVKEGRSKWADLVKKVQDKGTPGEKIAVGAIQGTGWLLGAFGRGVANQFREDVADVRDAFTPEGRAKRDTTRAEARERRARRRQTSATLRAKKTLRRSAKRAPTGSDDPEALVKCPRCAGRGCSECEDSGLVPAFMADPEQHGAWLDETTGPPQPAPRAIVHKDGFPPDTDHDCPDCGASTIGHGPEGKCARCSGALAAAMAKPQTIPATPVAGPAPANGGNTMPEATGEGPSYSAQIAEWNALAVQAEGHQQFWANLGTKGENLSGQAANAKIDRASLGKMGAAIGTFYDNSAAAGAAAAACRAAAATLASQQGGLAEAHAAQPEAADKQFFQNA